MQSRHTSDTQVLEAFREAESRLRAIAHIHERLYASDDLTEVEFAGYLTGLANELVQLHSGDGGNIELDLEVADIVLHVERAIPLGLIANELISNSLKHGLGNNAGRLFVRLAYLPANSERDGGEPSGVGWAQLEVTDSGIGIPAGLDVTKTRSMGMRLVNMLVRQLRGRLEIGHGPGARLTVSFPLEW